MFRCRLLPGAKSQMPAQRPASILAAAWLQMWSAGAIIELVNPMVVSVIRRSVPGKGER